MTTRRPSRVRSGLLSALLTLVLTLAVFCVVEGASSALIVLHEGWLTFHPVRTAEQLTSRFDTLLGWVQAPNIYLPDLYGRGVFLRTNARGFRGARDVTVEAPPGKVRVICSGDSFTLGYGVDDDHTWCHLLEARIPRLETVNMGNGGYGVDQAYLWYKRDGRQLEHQVHLFAFITDDFRRMKRARFGGGAKPVLAVRHDSLVLTNVPLPPPSTLRATARRLRPVAAELRVVELLRSVAGRLSRAPQRQVGSTASDSATWAVARRIFKDLKRANDSCGSTLVLVYLPTPWDYRSEHADTDVWRQRLHAFADSTGVPYVDLVQELRALDAPQIEPMFIAAELQNHLVGARGHFTAVGNAWAAAAIERSLHADPVIAARLAGQRTPAARAPRLPRGGSPAWARVAGRSRTPAAPTRIPERAP